MHTLWSFLLGFGLIAAMFTVVIAVHEAGHLLAGRLVGLRWKMWEVGALRVSREGRHWRLSVSERWQGGLVSFMPVEKRITRLQLAAMILGGVAANVLLGLVLLVYILNQPLREQTTSGLTGWLGSIAAMSFFAGTVNLFPFQSRGLSSDGFHLWWLLRNGGAFQEYYAQWDRQAALEALDAAVKRGIRPRDWDTAQVRRAVALNDGATAEAVAAHHAFYWAADGEDWPQSGRHIGRAVALLKTLPETHQVQVLLDAAYHEGLCLRDGVAARGLMAEAAAYLPQASDDEAMRRSMTLRAEAAALLAEGKRGEAEHTAREALSALEAAAMNNVADRSLTELLISCCSVPAGAQCGNQVHSPHG